jgi:hypothetical protein
MLRRTGRQTGTRSLGPFAALHQPQSGALTPAGGRRFLGCPLQAVVVGLIAGGLAPVRRFLPSAMDTRHAIKTLLTTCSWWRRVH